MVNRGRCSKWLIGTRQVTAGYISIVQKKHIYNVWINVFKVSI